MYTTEIPRLSGYGYSLSLPDNIVGQTTHWKQSRKVRTVAGVAVLALGAAAGFAASFLAGTFVAMVTASLVTVVLAVGVARYCYHHRGDVNVAKVRTPTPTPAQPLSHPRSTREGGVRELLAQYGHRFYQSSADGNCFYDSIAHQCSRTVKSPAELRRRVADFARDWLRRHPVSKKDFTPIETRAFCRLQEHIQGVPNIANGLDEIGTQGCFADIIDIYFASQVLNRPIVVIDFNGNIILAVDENGQSIGLTSVYQRELFRSDTILLVHNCAHFMGID